ncbi:Peptidyl-tRNA hydrolase family protein [Flavobacterium psychrophilum]|nr:Peptidyl-tRNA hydrolase family protein [Flavobacterium psychrophilum]
MANRFCRSTTYYFQSCKNSKRFTKTYTPTKIMESEKIKTELTYKAVRSSGAGGQNVNKVSSKVVLSFDLQNSQALSEEEKELILVKLSSRLTSENILILNCDEDRSQLKNKAIVTKRFLELLKNALIVPKIRKATRIPKSVIRKRIKDKKNISEIKNNRKKPNFE